MRPVAILPEILCVSLSFYIWSQITVSLSTDLKSLECKMFVVIHIRNEESSCESFSHKPASFVGIQ